MISKLKFHALANEWERMEKNADSEKRLLSEAELARGKMICREMEEFKDYENRPEQQRETPGWNGSPGPVNVTTQTASSCRFGTRGEARSARYEDLFGEASETFGFKSLAEYARDVFYGKASSEVIQRALTEGTPSDGGALVPPQFSQDVFNVSLEWEIVRPAAANFPMSSKTRTIPATTITDASTGEYFGGVRPVWTSEEATLDDDTPTVRSMELTANKLTCYGTSSNEWLDDGIRPEETIQETFTQALGYVLDRAFLVTGTGAGQPMSILNADCTYEVSPEGGQSGATVVYENLAKMISRMHPASFNRSAWIVHASCIPELLGLSIAVGTGGSQYQVFSESGGQYRILSRPAIITDKLNTLGEKGDIMLCDLSQYAVGLNGDMRLESSSHLLFNQDKTAWRLILRLDGEPLWNETAKDPSGRETSPFVVLGERS